MTPKAKLLLIDDDTTLIAVLDLYLTRFGYSVCHAGDGMEGLRQLFEARPDLVVLDLMMPILDGFGTCRRIRDMSSVPIIVLTARTEEQALVDVLDLGADDYVPKPFSLRELEARIDAILRRAPGADEGDQHRVLYMRDELVIDSERWEVRRDGDRVDLTRIEANLLFYLAENAGQALSHRQILQRVWGPEYVDNVNYPKLVVCRLRKKVEPAPKNPKYILTERGIGYRMALPTPRTGIRVESRRSRAMLV